MKYIQTTTIALVAIATVMLLTSTMSNDAFAGHPLITGWTHTAGNTDICLLESEFNFMLVQGGAFQGFLVTPEVRDAIADWNGQTSSFSFNEQTTCTRQVGASGLSGGLVGLTTVLPATPGPITDVDFDFDTSGRNWWTNNTCTDAVNPNIEYVATHELGHWLTFDHPTSGTQAHTVMWPTYNCNALDVQPADATELDDVY